MFWLHLRTEVVAKVGESLLQLGLVYCPGLVPGIKMSSLSIGLSLMYSKFIQGVFFTGTPLKS